MGLSAIVSAREKIKRASDHRDTINAALKPVLTAEPQTQHIAVDLDSHRHRKLLTWTIPKVDPLEPSLSLMIGDCIHNLRSALDHLVYQLAVLHGTSTKAADKTFFPICLTESDFNDRPKKFVKPYISGAAFAEIEKSQPYASYDVPAEADIWILHKLDIIDKHRLLIVAGQQFAATDLSVAFDGQEPFNSVISDPKWKRMEDGAEVIRLEMTSIGDFSQGEMNMKVGMARTVEFIDTGLRCDGMAVVPALDQLIGLVGAIVRDFGKQFFGE